ncbi:MAG: PilZ domain-containing protein [Ketobacteraceae bacterium]|nr:PilZ domain-containing protein [Ketobacteraceae bacterium]
MNEKRHFTRVQFDASATLRSGDQTWDTNVIDISMKGALVEQPEADFATDQNVELTLTLSDNSTQITMQGKIAHVENRTLGVVCEHIDVDSVSHLRRIVELNTGNPDLLERELDALTHYTDRDSFH